MTERLPAAGLALSAAIFLIASGFASAGAATRAAPAHVFVVDSLGDAPDANTADGVCSTGSGDCSLRAAIQQANSSAGSDAIDFSVLSGVQTISPLSPLPAATDPVAIDGTTQPGFSGMPLVVLDGSHAGTGTSADGLTLSGGSSSIRGLVINGWNDDGVEIRGAGGNSIQGNTIGMDPGGTTKVPNGTRSYGVGVDRGSGVRISGSAANLVGGVTLADRNLISGNIYGGVEITGVGAAGNTVEGNYMGTDVTGTRRRGNGVAAMLTLGASGNTIGGTAPGAGNLLSGNDYEGVRLSDVSWTTVQGNIIGPAAGGATKVAVDDSMLGSKGQAEGVRIKASNNNVIGGTAPGAANVISANQYGIRMSERSTGNAISGNVIGANASVSAALGNTKDGVIVADGGVNVIGGTTAGAGNVIVANRNYGIDLRSSATVQGNSIGTDPNGTLHLGNLWNGVFAAGKNTVIGGPAPGAPNLIAYNSRAGVLVSGSGVTVSANSIWGNNGLGIDLAPAGVTANDAGDLDAGANGLQNFPLLSSVTAGSGDVTVAGSIDTTASTSFTIEFFASPSCDASGNGEGQYFLGSLPVTTGPGGGKVFSATLTSVSGADQITATATGPSGTSEFSACAT